MMPSIMNKNSDNIKKQYLPIWVILFWIALWQFFSMIVNSRILLPSPLLVFGELFALLGEAYFWQSLLHSMLKITLGFLLAVSLGVISAAISHKSEIFKQIISPFILVSKSVPVASIIILILIWISADNISVFISFIMVMPIVYTNVLMGIGSLDRQLSEMATIFNISAKTKIRYIIIPQIMPFFKSASTVGLGMCFKAGIAAEVIGLPDNSIGEKLYEAKIFLDTPTLFAWTIVIIIISFVFEKTFTVLIEALNKRLGRVNIQ